MKEFQTTIKDGCSLGAFVPVPFDIERAFGKNRVKVVGSIDGLPFKGIICKVIPFGQIIVLHNSLLKALEKQEEENVFIKLDVRDNF